MWIFIWCWNLFIYLFIYFSLNYAEDFYSFILHKKVLCKTYRPNYRWGQGKLREESVVASILHSHVMEVSYCSFKCLLVQPWIVITIMCADCAKWWGQIKRYNDIPPHMKVKMAAACSIAQGSKWPNSTLKFLGAA